MFIFSKDQSSEQKENSKTNTPTYEQLKMNSSSSTTTSPNQQQQQQPSKNSLKNNNKYSGKIKTNWFL